MNAEDLKNIKTEYVKSKIRGMRLTQQVEDYITNLIALEHAILGGATSWGIALRCNGVNKDYKREYLEILGELNPEKYLEELEMLSSVDKVSMNLTHRREEEEQKKARELKDAWEKLGVKL